ncbi:diacylglycerol kinase family protein [Aeoliella mucimassa]|uniref:Undecaprenol kinase n=1 Tax=Aeoliella mucimassa TaxID=2527972 RepID=A0A518AIF0_9BACT|nr:diacylglycerol kinase family protein [Aeoliella mucimassa]QDU54515.1 Undecaprenol kinase [Aeoliella mucimassa]
MKANHGKTDRTNRPSIVGRWTSKFACAFRGLRAATWREDSFHVHLPAAVVVCGVAVWLGISKTEWLALVLCITMVLTAELMNTAIEHLSRAITQEEHPEIRDALDVASGAVLVASLGAGVIGVIILICHLPIL